MGKTLIEQNIVDFKNYLYEEEKSDNTIQKYVRDVRILKKWLGERLIDKNTIIEYKNNLCKKYAPGSVNSMLSSVNKFFEFMTWNELKVKTLKIQKRIFAAEDKELTKTEYEKLLEAAKSKRNEKLYYLMQTIASTGIRISELCYITVKAINKGETVINCKGKMRVVFLTRQLCKMLQCYVKKNNINEGPVFVTKNGKPLDRSSVWKMLKGICKSADVLKSKVFPHNFRHLFARTFYAIQKDIVRLADILGHSSIETTRIYTMESCSVHIEQLKKLGLLQLQ